MWKVEPSSRGTENSGAGSPSLGAGPDAAAVRGTERNDRSPGRLKNQTRAAMPTPTSTVATMLRRAPRRGLGKGERRNSDSSASWASSESSSRSGSFKASRIAVQAAQEVVAEVGEHHGPEADDQ